MTFQAHIIDAEALREIAPVALRAYAEAQGWQRVETFGKHSAVYAREGAPEAIIPATASIGDYARAVSDLIALFANVEQRSELQVYNDLSTGTLDVIRFRAPRADDGGSVQLETGVELVNHARDLLLSAACSVSEPRAAYRAGRVKEAAEYLTHVRLGQTERGSFVVTLLSPVPPALETTKQPTLWPMPSDEPFERRVTRRLMEGLEAARDAVEKSNQGEGFPIFETAVQRGVSANLCEAAASLIERGNGLDISVTWAYTRLTPEKRRRVIFASPDADILREAARLFRNREPRSDETLEGYIIRLARDEDEQEGFATLRTLIEARQSSVRIALPKQLYEQAAEAHKKQIAISIKGDLVREGQRWRLDNARELAILPAEDEGE